MTNRRSLKTQIKPSIYPITVTELKAFLKIDGNDEDLLLNMIIEGCTYTAQIYCSRFFINHTLVLTLDSLPNAFNDFDLVLGQGVYTGYNGAYNGEKYIDLPCPPAVSVASIKTYSTDNIETVYSSSNYRLDAQSARVYLNDNSVWPAQLRDFEGIKVEYVAGYGATADLVPAGLKLALLSYMNHAYECRGECTMTDSIRARFEPYKVLDMLGWIS